MKRKSFHIAGFLLVVFLWIPTQGNAQSDLQRLYKLAMAEGEVTIWSPNEWIRDIQIPEFRKNFPGIRVNFFEIRPSDFVPRVLAEVHRGLISLDVGTGRYAAVAPLLERGLIQSYDDWTRVFADLNPAGVSEDGRFLLNGDLTFVIAYNTKLVSPQEAPTSWEELLAPKWKGKIILEPRANAFAYLALKWGKERMVDYTQKLRKQAGSFARGGTTVAQQLAAGAGHVAVGAYGYRIMQLKRDGAPVDYARKVSPVGTVGQYLFVMNKAPRPNAAKLVAGWLASERAQRLIQTQGLIGSMVPGSSYIGWQDAEKNSVQIIRETLENYEKARDLNVLATKALGVLK